MTSSNGQNNMTDAATYLSDGIRGIHEVTLWKLEQSVLTLTQFIREAQQHPPKDTIERLQWGVEFYRLSQEATLRLQETVACLSIPVESVILMSKNLQQACDNSRVILDGDSSVKG